MKNIFHGIASLLFVAWVFGVIAYDAFPRIHYLLLGSIVAALITFALYRTARTRGKSKR